MGPKLSDRYQSRLPETAKKSISEKKTYKVAFKDDIGGILSVQLLIILLASVSLATQLRAYIWEAKTQSSKIVL